MDVILTRCGYRCDLCLAYKPNVQRNESNRQKLSDGWFKYFGFRLQPDEICCDGCMSENPHLIDQNCPVRPCVISRGIDNCSQCDEYVCARLKERLVLYDEIRSGFGGEIPEEDRNCFIRPYENKNRLDDLRSSKPADGDKNKQTASG
jgi:hypothetical protein